MNDTTLIANPEAIIQLAKALSNPIRVKMITYLASAKMAMPKSFERSIGIRQYQASKHLKVLRSAGIFKMERIGSIHIYRLNMLMEEILKNIMGVVSN